MGPSAVPPRGVNCGTRVQRVRWSATGNSESHPANIRKASVLAIVRSPEFLVFTYISRLLTLPDVLAAGARQSVRRVFLCHRQPANGTTSTPHDSTPRPRLLRSYRGQQM